MMTSNNIIKAIKFGIYSIVLAVPVFFIQTVLYPFAVPKTLLFQSIVEIIFFLWLGLIIFEPKYRLRFTPLSTTLLVFIGLVFLSAILGVDFYRSFWSSQDRMTGIFLIIHFLAFFMIATSLKKEINWQLVFSLSFLAGMLVSVGAFIQHFWFHDVQILQGWQRPGSTFGNPSFLAGYLLPNIFLGLWLLSQKINNQGKVILNKIVKSLAIFFISAVIAFEIYIVFLTQTRGAILGLVAGFLTIILYFILHKPLGEINHRVILGINLRKVATGCLILLLLFVGIFFTTRSAPLWQKLPGFSRLANFSLVQQQLTPRFIAWRIAWQSFLEKPVLGWGWENFNTVFDRHYDPNILTTTLEETHWDKPHNIFLEYLVTGGIFGFLAYIGIFAALFYELYKSKINQLLKILLLAAVMAYMVQNVVIFDTIGTLLMIFIILIFIDSEYVGNRDVSDKSGLKNKFISNFWYITIIFLLLACGLIPVYFINWRSFYADNQQYWGINYLLNRMPNESLVSYNNALAIPNPYRDYTRKDFVFNIVQTYKQGIIIPDFDGNLKKGFGEIKEIIKNHPEDYFYYNFLADLYNESSFGSDLSYLEEAEKLSSKALELSPKRQEILFVMAKTKLLKGNIKEAREIFEKSVAFNPAAADPHFFFGMMAYGTGDPKKGAEEIALAESLGRIPQSYNEAVILGDFVGDNGNYKKAIEYYKLAWKYNNYGVSDVWLKLAIAYFYNEQSDLARDSFFELSKRVTLKSLPIYNQLKPLFQSLKLDL